MCHHHDMQSKLRVSATGDNFFEDTITPVLIRLYPQLNKLRSKLKYGGTGIHKWGGSKDVHKTYENDEWMWE